MLAGLRVGTDFTGVNSLVFVLLLLNVQILSSFSCDVNEAAQRLIANTNISIPFAKNYECFGDIRSRSPSSTPAVDVYMFTPECTPWSSAGKRKGTADARGMLWVNSIDYIVAERRSLQ